MTTTPTTPAACPDYVYKGSHYGSAGAGVVRVYQSDGRTLVGMLDHVVRHSPTGFSWGYGGSGPADLARSLLIAALGDDAKCRRCAGTHQLVWDALLDDFRAYNPRTDAPDPAVSTSCFHCDDGYRPLPYQRFKADVVCSWPDDWTMTRTEILDWLTEHEAVDAA